MAMRNICMLLLIIRRIGAGEQLFNETEGSVVRLPCETQLDPAVWMHQDAYIYAGGTIADGVDKDRFSVNSTSGLSTLIITNVFLVDSGLYRCIEDDGIGKEHQIRLVISKAGTEASTSSLPTGLPSSDPHSGQTANTAVVVASLCVVTLVLLIIAIVVVVFLRRRYSQRHQNVTIPACTRPTEPLLGSSQPELKGQHRFGSPELVEIGSDSHFVFGIDELDGRLYVVFQTKHSPSDSHETHEEVRVIELQKNGMLLGSQSVTDLPEIKVPDAKTLVDVVACDKSKCLYVAGFFTNYEKGRVWRVSLEGEAETFSAEPFLPTNGPDHEFNPTALSVRSGNLLVTSDTCEKLTLYDPSGSPIKDVPLKGRQPAHAVETSRNTFIVCFRKQSQDQSSRFAEDVCEFDGRGHRLKCCTVKFDNPIYLTLDITGRLFVADAGDCECVVVLDNNLNKEEELNCRFGIVEARRDEHMWPWQLCYIESTGELLVSVEMSGKLYRFKPMSNGRDSEQSEALVEEHEV